MSELTTRTLVRCPVDDAWARLSHYFARCGRLDGTVVRLRINVERFRGEASGKTGVVDSVVAVVVPMNGAGSAPAYYGISWPAGSSSFIGRLSIELDADDRVFFLCFRGDYVASPAAGGAPFDALAGRALAKRTVAAMLIAIADEIEYRVGVDERSKTARVHRV